MPERHSALADAPVPERHEPPGTAAARVVLQELKALSIVQVDAFDNAKMFAAMETLCPGLPPVSCNLSTVHDDIRTLGIGPQRWLVVAPESKEVPVRIIGRISADVAAITDVSHGRTVVRVSGRNVRRMLAKMCIVDLDARAFGPCRCAQTLFGQTVVVLDAIAVDVIDVYFNRSFAASAWEMLFDAAAEYGFSVV